MIPTYAILGTFIDENGRIIAVIRAANSIVFVLLVMFFNVIIFHLHLHYIKFDINLRHASFKILHIAHFYIKYFF